MPSITFEEWIGRYIGQRYRLERLIGIGRQGGVFLTEDTLLRKTLALKLYKNKLADDESLQKSFKRETSIEAALNHQHIVQTYDWGITEERHPFFVMEYLPGETLAKRIAREKTLPIATCTDILTQICRGLIAAQVDPSQWQGGRITEPIKIIHRNLKPENIFLVPSELFESGQLVKIMNFGSPKNRWDTDWEVLTDGPGSFPMIEDPFPYASPEEFKDDYRFPIDERSNIYTLGVILYQMLSGSDPFGITRIKEQPKGLDWAMAHVTQPPEPLSLQANCANIDPRLEAIVERCLAKAPETRFNSVEELMQTMQSLDT